MTTTSSPTSSLLLDSARIAFNYGQMLVKDIPAEKFAHMPHSNMTHPAFAFGHLAVSADIVFPMLGSSELASEKPGYNDLFSMDAECVEQDGRYPSRDEIVDYYIDRYKTLIDAVASLDDGTLMQPVPVEGWFRDTFSSLGSAANFMLNGHHMMHLGQVSAWRRTIGLGRVF